MSRRTPSPPHCPHPYPPATAAEPPELLLPESEKPAPPPPAVADFARQELGFYPDEHQLRILNATERRGIINCCRQWGKSTTVAVRAVHFAYFTPGSTTIVASRTARQSAEFMRKAARFLMELRIAPRGDGTNNLSLLLPNGARIVGLPGKPDTIRGFSSVGLLLIDEASRVPDDLYRALRPMVAANADAAIWLMSTPNGRQGFFYEEWARAVSGRHQDAWFHLAVPATECPRILPAFLEEERRDMGDEHFRQEYLCEFTTAQHAYFNTDAIDDAYHESDPSWGGL